MNDHIEKIKELYRQEKYKECISFADKILSENGDNIDLIAYKASALSHLGLFNQSVEEFSKCIEIDNSKFYIWVLRGDAYSELNDSKNAFYDYWNSIQLEPNNGAVLDKMARILFNLGNEDDGIFFIKKAVDIGDSPEPMLVMMAMLNKMGMYGFLHELYEKGIIKFPDKKEQFEKFRSTNLFQQ